MLNILNNLAICSFCKRWILGLQYEISLKPEALYVLSETHVDDVVK